MTVIRISAADQELTVVQEPTVASGDVETVKVEATVSEHWNGFTLSAVFFTDKDKTVYEIILSQNACNIPREVLTEACTLYIGLRGVLTSGEVKTSDLIKYKVVRGAPTGTATAAGATPDVYQQFLAAVRNAEALAQSVRDDADAGKFNGKDGTGSGNSYIIESEGCTDIFPDQSYHNLDHSPAVNLGGVTDSPIYELKGYHRGNELYEGRNGVYENGYSAEAHEGVQTEYDITGYIPLTVGQTIRVKGMAFGGDYGGIAFYSSQNDNRGFVYFNDLVGNGRTNDSGAGTHDYGARVDADGVFTFTMSDTKKRLSTGATESTGFSGYGFDHIRLCCLTMDDAAWENVIITVDELITDTQKTLDPSVKILPESLPGDMAVGSSDACRIMNAAAFTSGVFWDPESLPMEPYVSDTMKVRMNAGTVLIDGVVKKFAAHTRTFNVSNSDRVDACVIRLDQETGEIKLLSRVCTEVGELLIAVDDNALLPIRDGKYYDIVIYKVNIPAGATQITSDMITDLRYEELFCGFVKFKGDSYGLTRKTVVPKTEISFLQTDGVLDAYFVDLTAMATEIPSAASGDTYIVRYNNIEYACTMFGVNGGSVGFLGDEKILGTWGRYSSHVPFCIEICGDSQNSHVVIYSEDYSYASIEIIKVG